MQKIKIFSLFLAILFSAALYADEVKKDGLDGKDEGAKKVVARKELREDPDGIGVIQFKVTIYKNEDNYNKDAWKEAINNVASIFDNVDGAASPQAVIDGIYQSLKTIHKYSEGDTGIHGEVQITVGNKKDFTESSDKKSEPSESDENSSEDK